MKNIITNRTNLIFLIAFMCVLPIMSSDLYFPILPEITFYFHTTSLHVQNSLSLFLFGFALGQLFYGVLSDHVGRKTSLITGLVICFFSTVGCALAPTIEFLNYARFFQGFGACAGAIMGRAIVADCFDVKESAYLYTIVGPFIGSSPAISPLIGGVLSLYWGWQSIFVFLACVVFGLLMLILLFLQESHTKRSKQTILGYFQDCTRLIHNKEYLCFSSFACGAYLAWFAFIVESSFIFSSYNLSVLNRSFLYVPLAVPYIIGNYMAKSFLKKMEMNQVINKGLFLYNAGLVTLAIYTFFASKLLLIMIAMFFIVMANGVLIPLGTAGALGNIEVNKGAATAVLGFVQLALSSLGTYIVSFFEVGRSQVQLVLLILFCSLVMWFCQRKLFQNRLVEDLIPIK